MELGEVECVQGENVKLTDFETQDRAGMSTELREYPKSGYSMRDHVYGRHECAHKNVILSCTELRRSKESVAPQGVAAGFSLRDIKIRKHLKEITVDPV